EAELWRCETLLSTLFKGENAATVRSEQSQLLRPAGNLEKRRIERRHFADVYPKPPAGFVKPLPQKFRIGAGPCLPLAPNRVVLLSATHITDPRHDVFRTQ